MNRVSSNDSLSRFQWNAMPAGGSFAARIRSHASMDRLVEEDSDSEASPGGAHTPLAQMHDITEELTTQLTGNLKVGKEQQKNDGEGGSSQPTDPNPAAPGGPRDTSNTPGPYEAVENATLHSKGGDESGLMLPSQAAGDTNASLFSRGDSDMPQAQGLSTTSTAAPGSPLGDAVMGGVPVQARRNVASSDVSSMSPHRGAGNDSMTRVAASESDVTLGAISGSTLMPTVPPTATSGSSPHMSASRSSHRTRKMPADGLNVHSATVPGDSGDSGECEHDSQIEFGVETQQLLSKVGEVKVAVDAGPFGSPSEPVAGAHREE